MINIKYLQKTRTLELRKLPSQMRQQYHSLPQADSQQLLLGLQQTLTSDWQVTKSMRLTRNSSLFMHKLLLLVLMHKYSKIKVIQGHRLLHYTHPFNGPLSRTTWVSRQQKGIPVWILLKEETVSGSNISWAICKSAPHSRQITTSAPHHLLCPSCHPTNSVKALKASVPVILYHVVD